MITSIGTPLSRATLANIMRGWNRTTRALIQMPGIFALRPFDLADNSFGLMRQSAAASSNVNSVSK
jgi:hypothetical protein